MFEKLWKRAISRFLYSKIIFHCFFHYIFELYSFTEHDSFFYLSSIIIVVLWTLSCILYIFFLVFHLISHILIVFFVRKCFILLSVQILFVVIGTTPWQFYLFHIIQQLLNSKWLDLLKKLFMFCIILKFTKILCYTIKSKKKNLIGIWNRNVSLFSLHIFCKVR